MHITMATTGLHWSSFVKCMKRVSCWPWMNSMCVHIVVYLKVLLVFNAIWHRNHTYHPHVVSKYSVFSIFAHWMYGMVSCWPWTNRAYVFIALCVLEFEVMLVLDAVWDCNWTLMRCWNTLQWWWRLCVDLRLLDVTAWNRVMLVPNGQLVRLYCRVHV